MNNEPVAYRHLHEDGWEYYDAPTGEDCKDCIPLYTHPAELTDEEYEKLMNQWDYWRKQIADGDKSSAPRDWFESTIDYLLEQY